VNRPAYGNPMRHRSIVIFFLGVAAAATPSPARATEAGNWPQFRGPGGSGVLESAAALPLKWSATENVAWVTELPGRGWSSPILWGDRVFVTSAVNKGAFKAPSTGIYGNDYAAELEKQGLPMEEIVKRLVARDIELTDEATEVSYRVFALDARTGKVLWQQEAHAGKPFGGRHRKNTYASETPVTDGERVYASFGGNVGLFCYSLDGALLWKRTWTPQPIYLDFGTASSPVVHDGRVYLLHDTEKDSFLTALDAKTGADVWTASRSALGQGTRAKSGWATPFVWVNEQRTEIVTIGKGLVISYGTDGRELWRLKGMTQAAPSAVAGEGLLFVGSGSQGESDRPMFAVRPGASGDISLPEGKTAGAYVSWFQPRLSAYTPSPLLYRGRVYVINNNGILQVADAKTGEQVYKARVGGGGQSFSSSPIAAGGRIYVLSEDGDTFVFEAGDSYRELAQNSLGEMSLATPAADADSLYVRTQTRLFRIRAAAPTARP
jgi:outer membrane protein assembly factor BamB